MGVDTYPLYFGGIFLACTNMYNNSFPCTLSLKNKKIWEKYYIWNTSLSAILYVSSTCRYSSVWMSSWSWSTVPVWGRPWIPSVRSVCWKEPSRRGRKNPQVSLHLSSFFLVLRESPKEIMICSLDKPIRLLYTGKYSHPLYCCPISSRTQWAKLRLGEFKTM